MRTEGRHEEEQVAEGHAARIEVEASPYDGPNLETPDLGCRTGC